MTATFDITESLVARFWAKVNKEGPMPANPDLGNCWLWAAGSRGEGYGAFKIGRKAWDAHRVAYVIENGSIPDRLLVLHECDNRACVRPSHLKLGTFQENVADAMTRGGVRPFRRTRTTPLTEGEIAAIKHDYDHGVSESVLCKKYEIAATSLKRLLGKVPTSGQVKRLSKQKA